MCSGSGSKNLVRARNGAIEVLGVLTCGKSTIWMFHADRMADDSGSIAPALLKVLKRSGNLIETNPSALNFANCPSNPRYISTRGEGREC
jgi:hypothetical protein